jgi:hypothetical protein
LGSIIVDASVTEENSTINASRSESPSGAARSSPTLAATEISDAMKPTIRGCRRHAITRIAPSQGTVIATPLTARAGEIQAPFAII